MAAKKTPKGGGKKPYSKPRVIKAEIAFTAAELKPLRKAVRTDYSIQYCKEYKVTYKDTEVV